jgi:hypothetical protein
VWAVLSSLLPDGSLGKKLSVVLRLLSIISDESGVVISAKLVIREVLMSREDQIVQIACDLYNRDHRGHVTSDSIGLLSVPVRQLYIMQAHTILVEKEEYEQQLG